MDKNNSTDCTSLRCVHWSGEQADLIFVFFDPMGQALCKRTLNIVEKLSEKCGDKLRFYLSKADEAGRETDRQVGGVLRMLVFCCRKSSIIVLSQSDAEQNPDLFSSHVTVSPSPFFFFFVPFTESNDADSSRAVPQARTQQMRLWNADDIHPQSTESKAHTYTEH